MNMTSNRGLGSRVEGGLAVGAAILVLFTAIVDPWWSVGLSVAVLVGLGVWSSLRR